MYCFIKYAELVDNQQEGGSSFRSIKTTSSSKSFRSAKGVPSKTSMRENKILMVNPDCYVQILVDYISSEIKFDKNGNFDLCDESGKLLHIKDLKPWHYASTVMEFGKTYVVVLCEFDDTGQYKSLDPIVDRTTKEYFDIMARLKKQIPSSRRLSNDSKRLYRRSADDASRTSSRITPTGSSKRESEKSLKKKGSARSSASMVTQDGRLKRRSSSETSKSRMK